jgi:AraC-like DNA-binding protein
MPNRPSLLSDRPGSLVPRVDVLTDLLETIRLRNIIQGRFDAGAPWGLRVPKQDSAAFYVVARGGAWLDGIEGQPPLALSSGAVVLVPGGDAHVLRDGPRSRTVALEHVGCRPAVGNDPIVLGGDGPRSLLVGGRFQFNGRPQGGLLERLPSVIHLPANEPSAAPWLSATVQLFIAESASPGPGSGALLGRLADVLFIQALRSQALGTRCATHGLRAITDPQIGAALSLMHGQPGADWTVEGLGEQVGMSRSGFAARFTELVGEPPLQYLVKWRMTKAAQQLRETDATIGTIAEAVGYQSEAAFHKAFKRWEGQGPGAYRRARPADPRQRAG